MKYYAQFMEPRNKSFNSKTMMFEECTPYEVECVGTDGVFILDGRNSIDTMINDAKDRANKLRNVKPQISSFKIIKGEKFINEGSVVYEGRIVV
jgi:hypothetical protein